MTSPSTRNIQNAGLAVPDLDEAERFPVEGRGRSAQRRLTDYHESFVSDGSISLPPWRLANPAAAICLAPRVSVGPSSPPPADTGETNAAVGPVPLLPAAGLRPSAAERVIAPGAQVERSAGATTARVEAEEGTPPAGGARNRFRQPLLIGIPVLAVLAGGALLLKDQHYVSTDNAYIRSTKGSINARVSGQVVEIAVRDNQFVRKGQLLFLIDPEPYRLAVAQAEARLASASLEVRGLKANYGQQLADLQSTKDAAQFARLEFERRKSLLASGFTARKDYDGAERDLKIALQHTIAAQQEVFATIAALNGNPGITVGQHPKVREARAEVDRAKLNLAYTRIVAPEDGIVTKVDDLQLGDFVNAGTATFAMMSGSRIWVEANFRETDLTNLRPGQAATVEVDAYPGHLFKAHVMSMSPGTGSQFSLLPPENATGNWVKVVQRLPVRLAFDAPDPSRPLYAGISVTVRVDTGQGSLAAGSWFGTLR